MHIWGICIPVTCLVQMDVGVILCVCLTRLFVFLGGVLALLVIYSMRMECV